ncbi:MAG: GH3 auxin-responsive promoter family protein [Candidatus Riflebacteria bacterium]|nr:GH3 auxin-responsive promoter family protein [Candidatus Riflebacteria bacterium]
MTGLLQGAWIASCLPRAGVFALAARRPLRRVQEGVLREILRRNADTAFGRAHGFAGLTSVEAFRRAVPVGGYEAHRPWIDRAAAGEAGVLTADPVRLFERSSGTATASKLVPYTAGLQEAFNRCLHPWMADLFLRHPGLWGGPAYWVVTPLSEPGERTTGGLPIGFAGDSEYFGGLAARLIGRLLAVPDWLRQAPDLASFRYQTLLCLLRAPDLRLISLWSPSFLPALLDGLFDWVEPLCRDLRDGTARGPGMDRPSIPGGGGAGRAPGAWLEGLRTPAGAQPGRAIEVETLLARASRHDPDGVGERLWPRLALLSTWTDGEAAAALPSLRPWFPTVPVQGKGLLATEGAVTIPLAGAPAPVLAATSAFFEFREGEEGETPMRPAWELEEGQVARVVMTTHGGLYRYELNDIVQVVGRWHSFPCLCFLGKEGVVSDLCGEKLHARHVERILAARGLAGTGAFLAPRSASAAGPAGYDLFLPTAALPALLAGAAGGQVSREVLAELAAALDRDLGANFHYDWCRRVGQLGPCLVVAVAGDAAVLREGRARRLAAEGRRLGTLKFPALSPQRDWEPWLNLPPPG